MLVESIVPLDFYSNIVGALIDQQVLQHIVKERMPELAEHFESIQIDLGVLAVNYIICLLGTGLQQEVTDRIWDLMFLKGHKMIFRFILAIFKLIEP